MNITKIDLLQLATSLPYANQISSFQPAGPNPIANVTFDSYDPAFESILGFTPTFQMIQNTTYKAFHEAGAYNKLTNTIYISSNKDADNMISVTAVELGTNHTLTSSSYPGLIRPNGACSYVPPGRSGLSIPQYLVWCDQGGLSDAAGLTMFNPVTGQTTPLITSFLGRNFTSPNDVKQHYLTGDLWFTDPQYGALQGFRPKATLPPQVYRFEPTTGVIQAVADQFVQPNGFEFSPDFKTAYISDTGAITSDTDFTRPATIYAYDVVDNKYLRNRRLFAYPDSGIPDGIHTDTLGNVWAGVGDGVSCWNADGELLGKIRVEGGIANFAFIRGGMLLFNEYRLFLVNVAAIGREVERDFGDA